MRVEIFPNAMNMYKFEIYIDDNAVEPDLDSRYIFSTEDEAVAEVNRIADEMKKMANKDGQ